MPPAASFREAMVTSLGAASPGKSRRTSSPLVNSGASAPPPPSGAGCPSAISPSPTAAAALAASWALRASARASASAFSRSSAASLDSIRTDAPSCVSLRARARSHASTEPSSTNTEPLKSLDSACRRMRRLRTSSPARCSSKKACSCSRVVSIGKGDASTLRSSIALSTSCTEPSALARRTRLPSALISRPSAEASTPATAAATPGGTPPALSVAGRPSFTGTRMLASCSRSRMRLKQHSTATSTKPSGSSSARPRRNLSLGRFESLK